MHTSIIERKDAPPPAAEVKAAIEGLTAIVTKGLRELEERVDGIEKMAARPRRGGGGDDKKGPSLEAVQAERKAIATFARSGSDAELKAMSVGSNPDGGYIVVPALSNSMTTKLYEQSPIRRLARIEVITEGDAFEEPIDNSESGASWVGENESRAATTTPTLGMLRVPVQEIYASQLITQRLLDDSRFNLGAWIEGKISDKFGRSEGTAYVAGDGVKRPRGFTTYTKVATADATRAWGELQYVPSGHASAFASSNPTDYFRNLYWSLRAPYRTNAMWIMASATANLIDNFKDGQGNYIWRNSSTAGVPPTLLGKPVEFSEDMDAVGANAYPVAFGDFKLGYLIAEKAGIKMLQDPFSSKPNVDFYAYRRVGGGLANSEAIKLMKCATS